MKFPSYQVAAAILIDNKEPMHYKALTEIVIKTQLSKLGTNAESPENTLNRVLNQDHPELFHNYGHGKFSVKDNKVGEAKFEKAISAYQAFLNSRIDYLSIAVSDIESSVLENEALIEGGKASRFISYYERQPRLRAQAIKIHGTKCMVPNCSFDFYKTYGDRGKDFIEVHHVNPLHKMIEERSIDPQKDMVVVCANCHRIIHRNKDSILTISQVGDLIKRGFYNIIMSS